MVRLIPEALRFEKDLEARLGAEDAANLRRVIAEYLVRTTAADAE